MNFFLIGKDENFTNITFSDVAITPPFSNEHVAMVAANEHSLLIIRFIVQKLCVPFVALVGVTGNCLCIMVLTRKNMQSSTTAYLTGLAAFDLLYLVFTLYLSLKHYDIFQYSHSYVQWFPYARVFTDMFGNVSVILTVTFTVERYIGVCHPMKGRILCTAQRAKMITIGVSTVAILCTTPEFWEMKVTWVKRNNKTVPVAIYTDFADHPSYVVGYYWFLAVMFTLLPLVLLCVFNSILIATVISAAKLRKQMTLLTPIRSRSVHNQPREQQKITKMLITVVIVFLICQLPGAFLLLYRTYTSQEEFHLSREQQNNLKIAGNITNLLIQINASINILLYSAMSTKFRRIVYRTVCNSGRGCLCLLPGRHKPYFSRTDGIQMSSSYGDRIASRMTLCSTYTFKVKLQNSSTATSVRDYRKNLHEELTFTFGDSKTREKKELKGNNGICSHKYNPLVINNKNDKRKGCVNLSETFEQAETASSSC